MTDHKYGLLHPHGLNDGSCRLSGFDQDSHSVFDVHINPVIQQ